MRAHLAVALLAFCLSACCLGQIRQGEIHGICLGHAKIEACCAKETCDKIEGGAISTNGYEVFGAFFSAVIAGLSLWLAH